MGHALGLQGPQDQGPHYGPMVLTSDTCSPRRMNVCECIAIFACKLTLTALDDSSVVVIVEFPDTATPTAPCPTVTRWDLAWTLDP